MSGLQTSEIRSLTAACTEAKSKAYCPYSEFRVGCAILTNSGEIIAGANVENAAYPVGSCAERVAMGTAVAKGFRYGDFRAIAIATDVAGKPASPCGMCRQFLREFCEPSMPLLMHSRDGAILKKTMGEVLPDSFGPDTLPSPAELRTMRDNAK